MAVLQTQPATVLDDYERLLQLAECHRYLDASRTTILKDNISWHFPFPGANTTPWQLEGTILGLRRHGYDALACVQNKTVVTNAFKGEDLNQYGPIFHRYRVPVLYNFRDEDMQWVPYQPRAKMLVLDRIFRNHGGIQVPDYFFGKNVVHLPTVKCHIYTTTTGAMKNAFGGLLNTLRHYTHSWIHETLVDLLAIQKEIHTGLFAMMDGSTAGNGPGPRIMYPTTKNVIVASGDQVAIDAISAKVMGFDPMSIQYIRLAHEEGFGVGDPREIEIVGDAEIAQEDWGFKVGGHLHSFLGYLAWFGPTKVLQKVIVRPPLVAGPIMFSEVFHDYYHWPLKEKKVYLRWREESPWGHLFARYDTEGAQAPSTAPIATA